MTKIISGFPCIGKSTIGLSNKMKYNDLEFRETAAQRGMTEENKDKLFKSYIEVVKLIHESNYYDYLFITDNKRMISELIEAGIPFTYIVPDVNDSNYIKEHKNRVIERNNLKWYEDIIIPRLTILEDEIEKIQDYPNANIEYLTTNRPFLKDIINL